MHLRHPTTVWITAAIVSLAATVAAFGCGGSSSSDATSTPYPNSVPTVALTPGSGGGTNATANATANSQAAQELCASIAQFRSAVSALTASRSASDLQSAGQLTVDATQRLQQAAAQASVAGSDSLTIALDNFDQSITAATSSGQPIAQSIVAVASAVTTVQGRVSDAAASGGCN